MKTSFRSLLATALAATLSVGAAHAQTALNASVYSPKQPVQPLVFKPINAVPYKAQSSVKGASLIQALTFRTVDSLQNAFSYYSNGIQPLRYEPTKNQIVTIRRGAKKVADDPNNNLDNLFIHRSNDMGHTWLSPLGPVDANEDPGPARYPSVYPYVQNGTLVYAYTFPFINTSTPTQSFGSLAYGLMAEDSPSPSVLTDDGFAYEGSQFTWGTGTSLVTTADNSKLVIIGNAVPPDGAATPLANTLPVQLLDLTSFELEVVVPSQLAHTKFPDPQQANSVTVTFVNIDRDATGALHMGFFGRFNENPDGVDARTFGVSSSSDNGQTWSDIQFLPASVVADYVATRGVTNPDSAGLSFTTDKAFAVTGNGNLHFVTSVLDFRANATAGERFADFVEISRINGNWSIHKIGDRPLTDRSAIPLQLLANDDPEQLDSLSDTQMMSELQLAKTVDGTHLVAKWIDYRSESPIFDEDLFAYGDNAAPDTMNVTDVFISASRVGSGQWTATPINITDDVRLDRITWIPELLPNSLQDIPLLEVQAEELSTDVTEGQKLVGQHDVVNRRQFVTVANFDASIAVGVNDPVPGNTAVLLGNARPNPVAGMASIQFTVPTAGNAVVELHDALGQKVATVFNGTAQAGVNNASVDANKLAAGIYYYTLRYNGTTETRMLSVVR